MNITVEFETKFNIDRNIMSPQTIDYQKVSGKLEQETKKFTASLEDNEENVIDVLRYIWELAFLYDGYFYIHSEAYEKINVNHRLSLLLNICDGFVINNPVQIIMLKLI